MFTFIARNHGAHILTTDNFALAERRAVRASANGGRASVVTLKGGERYRVNRYRNGAAV